MVKKRIPLGKRIAAYRAERRWSQRRLMEEMERVGYRVSAGFVGQVEAGHVRVPPKFAFACEQVLGLERGTLVQWVVLDHAERQAKEYGVSMPKYLAMLESAKLKPVGEVLRQAKELDLSLGDYLGFLTDLTKGLERKYEREFGLPRETEEER